jgi:hypothetical protein
MQVKRDDNPRLGSALVPQKPDFLFLLFFFLEEMGALQLLLP